MSDAPRILIDRHGAVAHVRLNRPDKMNALDQAMFEGIAGVIDTLAEARDVRCVVLSGEGRAFCAGLDMASMAAGGSGNDLTARHRGDANLPQQVAWGWRTLPMPVIAAVHGVAFGGGFQIMSGADVRIARPDTRMAIMEAKWGLVPDMAGFPLWRSIRDDVLRMLTYTAAEFDGAAAQGWGFVTELSDDPVGRALALAQDIAARSPDAVRGAKRLAGAMGHASDAELLRLESAEQVKLLRSPNQIEAVMAGMAKRPGVFAD